MKAPPFAYARARDLAHAFDLWSQAGPDARLLAGGQSLLAGLSLRLADTPALIDINHLSELRGISEQGERLRIGALTRHAELAREPLIARHAPAIAEAAPLIAHAAIRTRGTIGGSLAYADPAAELPACAVALEAEIVARSAAGERRIPAKDFFLGIYETALEPFEMIAAVEIPKLRPKRRQRVLELARRSGDYAIVGLVVAADVDGDRLSDVKIVYFGVDSAPVVAADAMAALNRSADVSAALAALDNDLDPPGDLQGGPATKRHLARVLLRRGLDALRAPAAAA
jgi:aerobic carbon-monoxide dehydrogenase medium subunit